MNFVRTNKSGNRNGNVMGRAASILLALLMTLSLVAPNVIAQTSQSQIGGESRDFRSKQSGRWIDLSTWQVFRSGVWIDVTAAIGVPNAATNAFIETGHTIIATRANVPGVGYRGGQLEAFVEVRDLHINTGASVTTTWGSVIGGFYRADGTAAFSTTYGTNVVGGSAASAGFGGNIPPNTIIDWYDGDRFGGAVNTNPTPGTGQDIIPGIDPQTGGNIARPRNMELRVYGKLRYYVGAALTRSDRSAGIQVTAATIGTGSTIVFRGETRIITEPHEWSTTFATMTGYYDNSTYNTGTGAAGTGTGGLATSGNGTFPTGFDNIRQNNFRGLMGRNSFWTAVFDLGRVVDRNFTTDMFTGPTDDASTAVGTIKGNFTAGIIDVRRGTVRVEASAFLANEGAVTSGTIRVGPQAVLQVGSTVIARTAVAASQFAVNPTAGNENSQLKGFGTNTTVAPWYPQVANSGTDNAAAANVHPFAGFQAGVGGSAGQATGNPAAFANGDKVAGTFNAAGSMFVENYSRSFFLTPTGQYLGTSRMRYFMVEDGGALEFFDQVGALDALVSAPQSSYWLPDAIATGLAVNTVTTMYNTSTTGASLSAADVRFNGSVIYSRTGDQMLVQESPYLFANPCGIPAGVVLNGANSANVPGAVAGGYAAVNAVANNNGLIVGMPANFGENGIADPYNNNHPSVDYTNSLGALNAAPAGLGVGTAALFAPSTTAAYSHLILRGSGTKYLIATTVTISRALIFQGTARLSTSPLVFVNNAGASNRRLAFLPFYLQQPVGGELAVFDPNAAAAPAGLNTRAPRAGFYPPLVYLRATGLTGFRQENNIGTYLRTTLGVWGFAAGNASGLGAGNYVSENINAANDNLAAITGVQGALDGLNRFAQAQPMWSVFGGNTDPVMYIGYTTASTSIASGQGLQTEGFSYPTGIVLSGSLNREQIDMTPWNKPAVIHGLPAEPTYLTGTGALGPVAHGAQPGARAVLYTTQFPSTQVAGIGVGGSYAHGPGSAAFGQVIRQSVDRRNGDFLSAIANTSNFQNGFPVITNSIFDFAINTTATTTLQYDTEANDIMSMVEFPASPAVAPHNLVVNPASNVVLILPIRTADYLPAPTAFNWGAAITQPAAPTRAAAGSVNFTSTVDYPETPDFNGTNVWLRHLNFALIGGNVLGGATSATIIAGPEYTNSTNGNLPRHAFDGVTGMYQASAIYNQGGFDNQFTPGVAASAYIDTRPDEAAVANRNSAGYYLSGVGRRPSNTLTGTFDGRVRHSFPVQRHQSPILTGLNTVQSVPSVGALSASSADVDFGRRGDYNNFGVLELRRGQLQIPSRNIAAHTANIPFDPNTVPTFNYTLVLSSTAIISGEQQNVTFGRNGSTVSNLVGANNPDGAFVVLSEADGGVRGFQTVNGYGPAPISIRVGIGGGTANGGNAVVRGPAGPLNLAGVLTGGGLSNMVLTGGTTGIISAARVTNVNLQSVNTVIQPANVGNAQYFPPLYGAADILNSGLTELPTQTGIVGLGAIFPSSATYYGRQIATSAVPATNTYNPGPEITSDADPALTQPVYDLTVPAAYRASNGSAVFSGNNQVWARIAGVSVASSSYNAGVVRANNAYNVDLPYVRGGLQHLTFIRATSNVLTLVGNRENSIATDPDNSRGNGFRTGVTATVPEQAGLQIYGTIATARGDIDLNGRNIEMGGNNSFLVETFERAQYVDSLNGTISLFGYNGTPHSPMSPMRVGMPRYITAGGNFASTTFVPVYPPRPSSVRNEHRNVRAYIGLTSHRNVAAMNAEQGVDNVNENVGGLGARIYQTGNPAQFRVRRWQTRGTGFNGALRTRPNLSGVERYWQIETTGTLQIPMGRSELRLQYIDTDLLNENGTAILGAGNPGAGLPPVALNIFRAQGFSVPAGFSQAGIANAAFTTNYASTGPRSGAEGTPPLSWGIAPNSPFLGPFQALFAQQNVGPDYFNFTKQLTVYSGSQTLPNGNTVLTTGNFAATGDPTNPVEANRTTGFQIWAIGVAAPQCIVIRGQRFGGSFGAPIGDGTNGRGVSLPGNAVLADGGVANGGISAATATNYGTSVGPFKAGIPTVATIIAELLNEFGQVATNFSTGAALRIDTDVAGNALAATWNNANYPLGTFPAQLASVPGVFSQAGRLEWTGVQINGIAATNHTLTAFNAFVGNDANGGTTNNPIAITAAQGALTFCDNQPVQISVQGGLPFSVTFATQTTNPVGAVNLAAGARGPLAVPGVVQTRNAQNEVVGNLSGSAPWIVVGDPVNFGNAFGAPDNNAITVIVRDRFGNLASFSTDATITLASGTPPIDPLATPMLGNQVLGASYNPGWTLGNPLVGNGGEVNGIPSAAAPGIARVLTDVGSLLPASASGLGGPANANPVTNPSPLVNRAAVVSPAFAPSGLGNPPITNPQVGTHQITFPNYQVWGATSNNVQLTVNIQSGGGPIGALGNTVATVTLHPGPARGIAPVVVTDPYGAGPVRVPSVFYIGRSNADNPLTWFYVQAVDEFGNRCSQGPNIVNGNLATIRFAAPTAGLPRNQAGNFQFSAPDFHTRVNDQAYTADGTTSNPAVAGLYTFNNFIPRQFPSNPFAVTMTFEDTQLQGINQPRTTGTSRPLFQPIPPITTATTQFRPVPVITLRAVNPTGGATVAGNPTGVDTLIVRERAFTVLGGLRTKEAGALRLGRPAAATNDRAIVGYTVAYSDSSNQLPNVGSQVLTLPTALPAGAIVTPAPPAPETVAINGLQGDLTPTTAPAGGVPAPVNIAGTSNPNSITLDPGVQEQLINFTARWSDQSWPRNPGIQNRRTVRVQLQPQGPGTIYDLDGSSTGIVWLLDPPQEAPRIMNAIQDKVLLTGASDLIELETPQFRVDGLPGFVFYDNNYNPMTYTAVSSDTTIVSVLVRNSDDRFQGRPTLFYRVQAGARPGNVATITVTANDGRGGLATDQFTITVTGAVTSVKVDPSVIKLSVAPNPVTERFTVEAQAEKAGTVRIKVSNTLGAAVSNFNIPVSAGQVYRQEVDMTTLPTGVYFVEINDGTYSTVQKVVKN